LPVEGPKASPATPSELVLDKPAIARFVIKPWGEIFVNGQSRGVSPPLKNLSLEPGEYKIEIRNGDYPGYKLRIKLKSGELYKINHTFTDPAQK
jgi:PEGA domain